MNANSETVLMKVVRLIVEHIWYAKGHPEQVGEIAEKNSITPEAALAYAIADQICEEFTLTPND